MSDVTSRSDRAGYRWRRGSFWAEFFDWVDDLSMLGFGVEVFVGAADVLHLDRWCRTSTDDKGMAARASRYLTLEQLRDAGAAWCEQCRRTRKVSSSGGLVSFVDLFDCERRLAGFAVPDGDADDIAEARMDLFRLRHRMERLARNAPVALRYRVADACDDVAALMARCVAVSGPGNADASRLTARIRTELGIGEFDVVDGTPVLVGMATFPLDDRTWVAAESAWAVRADPHAVVLFAPAWVLPWILRAGSRTGHGVSIVTGVSLDDARFASGAWRPDVGSTSLAACVELSRRLRADDERRHPPALPAT